MFRIKELYLKGFKNPDREVKIQFADAPVTIIYGENGSGKTTLLQVIQAIFKKDIEFLKSQNIKEVKVNYEFKQEIQQIEILIEKNNIIINNEEIFTQLNSILFGINRNVDVQSKMQYLLEIATIRLMNLFIMAGEHDAPFPFQTTSSNPRTLVDDMLNTTFENKANKNPLQSVNQHSVVDNISVQDIEKTLEEAFNKGEKAVLISIGNAFFNLIDNAINEIPTVTLSLDFQQRFNEKKNFFKSFIDKQPNSTTKQKLQEFLANDQQELNNEKPLFKALLKNMLEAAEKDERENIDLKAVTTLVSTFNEFVIHQKKLVLNAVEAYIAFPNGQRHSLGDLSSGERHLLSFLTLFLIIARDRNFFLIDEPEISLSMKWQRRLLTLLSEFSPNSQIIVATHSPEMADGKPEYLMKGKLI